MNIGLNCYTYFLTQLKKIITAAKTSENAALYLFEHDARTPLFMLEGLSRFYETQHNKKRFTKLKDEFKKLEDGLGSIDNFNWLLQESNQQENFPENIRHYFSEQKNNKLAEMNALLEKNDWLADKKSAFDSIQKKLESAKWQSSKEDIKGLEIFYKNVIKDIFSFYKNCNQPFTKMEDEVHELRRDLRWLSIYPKSLQGAIQLVYSKPTNPAVLPYLTEEIVQSPFNVMPLPGANNYFLLLEKQYFLALSYMISALGDIKDKGLFVFELAEAINATEKVSKEDARLKANQILNEVPNYEEVLLNKASQICNDYFSNKLLKPLIKGRSKKNKKD